MAKVTTLMDCDWSQLEQYGVEQNVMRANAPVSFHWKTLEAMREEGFLPTRRTIKLPQTTVEYHYYDPTEVQALYDALEQGWTPRPKVKLQLQFKNLSQEAYDRLAAFAASEGIEAYIPQKRGPRKARSDNGTNPNIEVVDDDYEWSDDEAEELVS